MSARGSDTKMVIEFSDAPTGLPEVSKEVALQEELLKAWPVVVL
jgi:hypothetical protein